MRSRASILVFAMLTLGACANSGGNDQASPDSTSAVDTSGTTGYVNSNGRAYVTNGNAEVEEALRKEKEAEKQSVTPSQPGSKSVQPSVPKPAAPTGNELRVRLKEFQISRFKKNHFKPSRFGDHRYSIIVFFRNENQVEFNGLLEGANGKWNINQTSGQYTLQGKFTDTVPAKNRRRFDPNR